MDTYIYKLLGDKMTDKETVADRQWDPVKLLADLAENFQDLWSTQGKSDEWIADALDAFQR